MTDRQLARIEAIPTEQKLLYRPEEVAGLLSISRAYVYELIESGELPSVQIGRSRRIAAQDLHQFVERLREKVRSNGMVH
jgi:excisionase family DNA binding protein